MKFARIIALSSSIAVALAQSLESLPDCGQLCVKNMLAKATELGCAEGDSACLCTNIDFAYGIRDCSHQVCGPEQAIPVIAYGSNYCKSATGSGGNSNTPVGVPGLKPSLSSSDISSTATPTHTQTIISNATSTMSSTAITSAVVTTITSGDDVETSTIGSATISSSTLVPSSTSPTSSDDDQATSTSSAGAAKQTFYAGFAAVAGIAALVI